MSSTHLVQTGTLAAYMGESTTNTRMSAALMRAEAMASAKIGCSTLPSREITERIDISREMKEVGNPRYPSFVLKQRHVFLSDGPASSISSVLLDNNGTTTDITTESTLSETGWSIKYRLPLFTYKVTIPYEDFAIVATYQAGWNDEQDLPNAVREYVLARATSYYHLPLGSGIKAVRIGDSTVELNNDGFNQHLMDLESMIGRYKRIRL